MTYEDMVQVLAEQIILYGLMLSAPIFLSLIFREFISNIVGGILWRFKSYYREEQIVEIDGEVGQIVHIGTLQTKFYIFIINDKKEVVGKWSMRVLNNHLRTRKVKVLAPNVCIPNRLWKAYL